MSDDDESVLVCERVLDMPIPPLLSSIGRCSECPARVWVAQSSPKARSRTLCMPCARKIMAADPSLKFERLTDEQVRDILHWHGSSGPKNRRGH